MSKTALIVVDMVNSYDHPDAEKLTKSVETVLPTITDMIDTWDGPTIYVNDNFGHWRSNRDDLLETALTGEFRALVEPIAPKDDAMFVVKARHSIFFQTPLEYLLGQEKIDRIMLVGQVTEQCILYTALDAYVRHFTVKVPPDAVAHIVPELGDAALQMMERNMRAEIVPAEKCLG